MNETGTQNIEQLGSSSAAAGAGFGRSDMRQFGHGLLMGGADIIPGVSGGTVALILGIYSRLVTAISRFDSHLVSLLIRRRWREGWRWVDARFLLALGMGISVGVIGLAKLMRYLLEYHRVQTSAVFFGLILGSTYLVSRRIRVARGAPFWRLWLAGLAAAWLAWWLVGLPMLQPAQESVGLGYVLLCGAIAICAMILPGISGAYFLLVLGLYYHLTDIIHRATRLEATPRDWATIAVFLSGCVIGLIGFSKALRWLLIRLPSATMAVLCGLMLGSLRRVWPFQVEIASEVDTAYRVFQPVLPLSLSADVWAAAALAFAAAVAVVLLDYVANHTALPSQARAARPIESPAE